MTIHQAQHELIGNTPVVKVPSLSKLTGSNIYIKCESMNPGGSIKDRAAKQIIEDAVAEGKLKPGMTVVEGTAGNTGIGLSLVAKSMGMNAIAVMPKGQAIEKERMIELYGGQLKLVDAVPFSNENHFYHTARRMAEENPEKYFWANQFENLSNFRAHYLHTGPEIYEEFGENLDYFVSVAGTGGTIGGNSAYLKEKIPNLKVHLIDPDGSGLFSYMKNGEFKSNGKGSFTEGIGIMRLVANFAKAEVDEAFNLDDQYLYTVAKYVRDNDGIVLGTSSALNVTGAFHTALSATKDSNILTFMCDLGERSYSKMHNQEFLKSREIDTEREISFYM